MTLGLGQAGELEGRSLHKASSLEVLLFHQKGIRKLPFTFQGHPEEAMCLSEKLCVKK